MYSNMIYSHSRISLSRHVVKLFSQTVVIYLLARTKVALASSNSTLLRTLASTFSRSTLVSLDLLLGLRMIQDLYLLLGIALFTCGNLTAENQNGNTLTEMLTLLALPHTNLMAKQTQSFTLQVQTRLLEKWKKARISLDMNNRSVCHN